MSTSNGNKQTQHHAKDHRPSAASVAHQAAQHIMMKDQASQAAFRLQVPIQVSSEALRQAGQELKNNANQAKL
jgi:hypothetical protein